MFTEEVEVEGKKYPGLNMLVSNGVETGHAPSLQRHDIMANKTLKFKNDKFKNLAADIHDGY